MASRDLHGFEEEQPIEAAAEGNNYLLVIGIDQYTNCPRLYNAVKDAKDLVQLLKKRFQFESEHIIEHYDLEATKRNIYAAFRSMAERVTPKDSLIVYFSGHGEYDKLFNLGYWIPVDAEKASVDQYVPNSEIRNILSAIKSHHTFLMVDSCFSGMLFAQSTGRNVSLRKERDPSRWGLTAGRNEIVDDGTQGSNSPFAKSILYQLTHTDKPIGVAELCDNVLEVVSANATQTPRGEPLKVQGHKGGQFVFHLRKDEVADWKDTISTGTLKAYQTFAAKYPEGKFNGEAKSKINRLLAATLWQEIEEADESNTAALAKKLELVNQYVDNYEHQPHYEEALYAGELLEYKKEFLKTKTSEFALRRFLRKPVPNIPGAASIKEEAQKLLSERNRADSDKNEAEARKKAEEDRLNEEKRMAEETRNKEVEKRKKVEQEKKLTEKRIAEEAKKKKKEQDARKALEQKNKAAADRKKEKERLAEQKKTAAAKKGVDEKVAKESSFIDKYGKFLIPLILIPIVIWGVIQVIPNNRNVVLVDTKMVPFQNTKNKLWGYKKGSTIAILPAYTVAGDFYNGEAKVVKNGQTFFIDNSGKCVRECPEGLISFGISTGVYNSAIQKGNEALKLETPDIIAAQGYFEEAKKIATKNNFDDSEATAGLKYTRLIAKRLKQRNEQSSDAIKSITNAHKLGEKAKKAKTNSAIKPIANTLKLGAGTFVDTRDKQSYKWMLLKDGKKWMLENLNYNSTNSWCYNNEQGNCKRYGRLYSWAAAKTACPTGWRLPSDKEWSNLARAYGGYYDWKTKKDIGNKQVAYRALMDSGANSFFAKLGGLRKYDGNYYQIGEYGRYWSSTGMGTNYAVDYYFGIGGLFRNLDLEKATGISCRCIQN